MKNTFQYLGFICAILLSSASFAFETDGEMFETEPAIETEASGFSLHFSGNAEEEGALKLFFKNYDAEKDPTADELNQISPAAGVKLQFEF